jgi:hypothetical protein
VKAIARTIHEYHEALSDIDRAICDRLKTEIDQSLPKAESKVWHGSPVWFLEGNPIVGYHRLKKDVRLLFWSGQSFEEPGLKPEGTFKAAEIRFAAPEEIHIARLHRWLAESKSVQWDYKNLVKRRGILKRLGE